MPLGLYTANLNFETTQEIGQQGRNSKVFLAHDKQLDGEIVVKRIEKTKFQNADEFYKEAKILYSSTHHNVVRVNYGCEDAQYIYIAMPYYKNGSLKTLITSKFLTVREVLRYSIQFLSGLNHIHTKGLMHFDIKSDNILLSDSDEALLADFGLAKAMNNLGLAEQGVVYPRQIPPEKFSQAEFSIQYDIYLAGLTIYRLLNGDQHYIKQFAFTSLDDYKQSIVTGAFPDRNSYLHHVPLKLRRIVNRTLEVDPQQRQKNVLELINELSDVDENLDWRYSIAAGRQNWESDDSNRKISIHLEQNGTNLDLKSYKEIKASGRSTRITDHCHSNLTTSNFTSVLQKALRECQ